MPTTRTTRAVAASASSSCCRSAVRGTVRETMAGRRGGCPRGNGAVSGESGRVPGDGACPAGEGERPAGEAAQMDNGPE